MYLTERLCSKVHLAYALTTQKAENEKVVGGSETGAKVNENRLWLWTFQSQVARYIIFSNNRGTATADENCPNGFINTILIHDCW